MKMDQRRSRLLLQQSLLGAASWQPRASFKASLDVFGERRTASCGREWGRREPEERLGTGPPASSKWTDGF